MSALLPIVAVIIIAAVSLMAVRIGAMALRMTGMSWDSAIFQAYSAFFGVGFTTREAESVVRHPTRRNIVQTLILAGNVGLTSALGALVVTFVKAEGSTETLVDLVLIVVGLAVFWWISRQQPVLRAFDRLTSATLSRVRVVDEDDYALLLRVQAGFCISQVEISRGHWLVGDQVAGTKARGEDILVLGVLRRNGDYIGAPAGDQAIEEGDLLTVYGAEAHVRNLAGHPDLGK